MRLTICAPFDEGFIDVIDIEYYGVIRVHGWIKSNSQQLGEHLRMIVDGEGLMLQGFYRSFREDVAHLLGCTDKLLGFIAEFETSHVADSLSLFWNGNPVWQTNHLSLPFDRIQSPSYGSLLQNQVVLHRDTMYGVGPPCSEVDPQFVSIASLLESPILDFGCGAGALIRELRKTGKEVYGLEIDRPEIWALMDKSVAEYITIYDGKFPLPFKDKQFRSVVSTEVIEHVSDYQMALSELFRVAQDKVFITVPDMASVPILAHLHVVPWHLLEATHLNFFTKRSLGDCLAPYVSKVVFVAISHGIIESTWVPGCLGAICDVKSAVPQ